MHNIYLYLDVTLQDLHEQFQAAHDKFSSAATPDKPTPSKVCAERKSFFFYLYELLFS